MSIVKRGVETTRFDSSPIVSRETKDDGTPRPCRIVAVANQKGGVGKTTTTVNISASLANLGRRVLVVDSDPQGNTTSGFGIDKNQLTKSLYSVLAEGSDVHSALQRTEIAGLDLLPATIDLAAAELDLAQLEAREYRLRDALALVLDWYDYVFIDCPPSLSLLTVNALSAATEVLIPVQAEFYALEGLSQLMAIVGRVREALNSRLRIAGVVVTMFDGRTRLATDVIEELDRSFPAPVFQTRIPRNVRLSEAPSFGKPVILYDAKSRGSIAYTQFAQEFENAVPAMVSGQ